MAITIPSTFKPDIERPHGRQKLIWLWELQLVRPTATTPSFLFRCTDWHQPLQWQLGDPLSPTYYPFPFSMSPLAQDSDGNLPQLQLSLDNTARTLMRYLHDGSLTEGNYATAFLVFEGSLSAAYPHQEFERWDFEISGVTASGDSVGIRLERSNFFERSSPPDRYVPSRCRHAFGLSRCGYIVNAVAAYTTCPKTVDACVARGLDEFSRGLPVLHPLRYGGFPGIPQQQH